MDQVNINKKKATNTYKKITYKLHEEEHNKLISIKIDENRKTLYYLTIKCILRELKPYIQEYEEEVPFQLLQFAVRLELEKRLREILNDVIEKIKYKRLFYLYRDTYPFTEDDDLVKNAKQAIYSGELNNPSEGDCNQDKLSKIDLLIESLQIKFIESASYEIPSNKGRWQVFEELYELETPCVEPSNDIEIDIEQSTNVESLKHKIVDETSGTLQETLEPPAKKSKVTSENLNINVDR